MCRRPALSKSAAAGACCPVVIDRCLPYAARQLLNARFGKAHDAARTGPALDRECSAQLARQPGDKSQSGRAPASLVQVEASSIVRYGENHMVEITFQPDGNLSSSAAIDAVSRCVGQ